MIYNGSQIKPQQSRTARRKLPKTTGVEFTQFLRMWEQHLRDQVNMQRKHIEMSVTMHRRDIGLTLSDMCGDYGTRDQTRGMWLDYDADLDPEIHPLNIVGPAIATNKNACLQSNSSTRVSAVNQSAKNKQIASRWQRVGDAFERMSFNEAKRAFIFDAIQKDGTVLLRTKRRAADTVDIPMAREAITFLSVYSCEGCSSTGFAENAIDSDGMGEMECPSCGKMAGAITQQMPGYAMDQEPLTVYDIEDEIIPLYNFTIDAYGAKKGGVKTAKFLEIHELVDRFELEIEYPEHKFDAAQGTWFYPLACDYALATNTFSLLNSSEVLVGTMPEFQKFQKRTIYLHESAYASWRSPGDFEWVNPHGEHILTIKEGQTIAEAYMDCYGFNPKGMKFVWIDESLVDIASPATDDVNFREIFSEVHWQRTSSGFYSSPNYSLKHLQDDITLLNTMNFNIVARHAYNPVWIDGQVFAGADFESEYIESKNAHLLGKDRDISRSVVQLPVPTPSPYLTQQLQFLLQLKDQVSNVTPALRGDAQRGETLGAVQQQLEQSYGMLTSPLKSFAQAKCNTFIHKAKIAQKCWPVEKFQQVASMFGEIWTEDMVQEMCAINFETDIVVDYEQGSEVPQSNTDKYLKFLSGLEQIFRFPPDILFQQLGPEKIRKLLEQIDSFAKMDFDLTGLEINETISQKRFIELSMLCMEKAPDITPDQIEMLRAQQLAIDETGNPITALDVLTEEVFAESNIRFSEYEDLEQQAGFYVEMLRNEIGKTKPNYLLIEMMHVLLGLLRQAGQDMQAEAMANDPEQQALAAQQEAQAAQAQADAQADRDAQLDRDKLKAATEMAKMLAAQEHEEAMNARPAEAAPQGDQSFTGFE